MAASTSSPGLVRQIGLWSGVAVVVGTTIGSGIFRSPAGIAEKLPGPGPMLAVWIVGGLFVLCGALTLAEVGSAYPYSGGPYVFIREGFGRLPGFLFGWAQLVLIRPSAVGAVALVFGEYAMRLTNTPGDDPAFSRGAAALAVGAILAVTWANIRGVKFGTGIQNLTTVAKVAGLLVLIVLAFAIGLPKTGGNYSPLAPPGSFTPSLFGLALVSALWAYDGWSDCSFVAGEMTQPKRNVPLAILFGTAIIIVVYLLANMAYLAVFSVQEIAGSQIIAADAMGSLVGPVGVTFIVATVMLSTFGTLNGSMLTAPRIFFAMAEDKLFFEPLARVHETFRTPHIAVALSGALGVTYVMVASAFHGSSAFAALTDAFVIGIVPFYALAVASVFVFRKRSRGVAPVSEGDSLTDPIEPGHLEAHPHAYAPSMRVPLFPVTPLLFIGSTLFLLVNSLIDPGSRVPTLITLGIVLLGIPVFMVSYGRLAKA